MTLTMSPEMLALYGSYINDRKRSRINKASPKPTAVPASPKLPEVFALAIAGGQALAGMHPSSRLLPSFEHLQLSAQLLATQPAPTPMPAPAPAQAGIGLNLKLAIMAPEQRLEQHLAQHRARQAANTPAARRAAKDARERAELERIFAELKRALPVVAAMAASPNPKKVQPVKLPTLTRAEREQLMRETEQRISDVKLINAQLASAGFGPEGAPASQMIRNTFVVPVMTPEQARAKLAARGAK